MTQRLKEQYNKEILPTLKERFSIGNDLAAPRLLKIVINMGVNGAVENKARVEAAAKNMSQIAGQKPTIRNAKQAIAA